MITRVGTLNLNDVGTKIKHVGGAVLLYRSADLIQWEYIGPLLVDDSGLVNKVWECPAFFPLEDKWVLIISATSRAKVDYFIGIFGDQKFQPEVRRRLDYGSCFYAPQTLLDSQNRWVLIGWICDGRSEEEDVAAGWSSSVRGGLGWLAGGTFSSEIPHWGFLRSDRSRMTVR